LTTCYRRTREEWYRQSRERREEIVRRFREGASVKQIALQFDVSRDHVNWHLREAGFRRGPERAEGHGDSAEAMARVYSDSERQEWVRREMALRDELIEHKRQQSRK
jgi:transposase-like protein